MVLPPLATNLGVNHAIDFDVDHRCPHCRYNLMMEPDCRRKYQFNTYNKNELLKLRGYLNGGRVGCVIPCPCLYSQVHTHRLSSTCAPRHGHIRYSIP